MESTGEFHHEVIKTFFSSAKDIFDNTTPLDASQNRFNDNSDFGNQAILSFLRMGQFLPFGFFLGLERPDLLGFIALQSAVFIQGEVVRKGGGFVISDRFILDATCVGVTQLGDGSGREAPKDQVFDRRRLLLAAGKTTLGLLIA
jgi:hypothetical protein